MNTETVTLPKTWAAIKAEFPGRANKALRDKILDDCRRQGSSACRSIALTACGRASLDEINSVAAKEWEEKGYHRVVVGAADYNDSTPTAYLDQSWETVR